MASAQQVRDYAGLQTITGEGMDPSQLIYVGRYPGSTTKQYVPNTPENQTKINTLRNQLASGPLGVRGADGKWDGVWQATDVIPEGQTVGTKATGAYANKAAGQNAMAALANKAYEQLQTNGVDPAKGTDGTTAGGTTPIGSITTTEGYVNPGTGLSTGTGFGDGLGGTTPPPTNAQVNNALTTVTEIMNNSRTNGQKQKSSYGTRPKTEGNKKPMNGMLNIGSTTKGSRANSQLGTISSVGLNF